MINNNCIYNNHIDIIALKSNNSVPIIFTIQLPCSFVLTLSILSANVMADSALRLIKSGCTFDSKTNNTS